MPSATRQPALVFRSNPTTISTQTSDTPPKSRKHRPCNSYTDIPDSFYIHPVSSPTNHRPSKRPMPTPRLTIAVVNSSGRQAASFIRVASAVGYKVRAQLRNLDGIVASEIASLPNVKVFVGDLYTTKPTPSGAAGAPPLQKESGINHDLIKDLFRGADLAFINTTFWGSETEIGIALADAAIAADIKHYIYSSMPNHSLCSPNSSPAWPSLPLWSSKYDVEQYIRTTPLLAKTTFLYTGIYNNNFTSLPYPLFCMELQSDGSFEWVAPFHEDVKLPWLDAEHDVGPAVLQIIKDGTSKWGKGERIALAYEVLSPLEACAAFSKGVGRPVRYRREARIEVKVSIPRGYREQLVALEEMYALPVQPPYFGSEEMENSCPREALELWEGHRGLEEYAREVFPLEEAANGLTWMNEDGNLYVDDPGLDHSPSEALEYESDDDALTMAGGEKESLGGTETPAREEESWLA